MLQRNIQGSVMGTSIFFKIKSYLFFFFFKLANDVQLNSGKDLLREKIALKREIFLH